MMTRQELQSIADYYGVVLYFIKEGDSWCNENGIKTYINRSYIIGGKPKQILIGIYQDPELEVLSFFHELGHTVGSPPGFFNEEEKAWSVGIGLAQQWGITFSQSALDWAKEQLRTYSKPRKVIPKVPLEKLELLHEGIDRNRKSFKRWFFDLFKWRK